MITNEEQSYAKGVCILKEHMANKVDGLFDEKRKITYGDFRVLKEKFQSETALEDILRQQHKTKEVADRMWFSLLYELHTVMTEQNAIHKKETSYF